MGFQDGKVLRLVLRATFQDDQEVNTFHYDLHDQGLGQPANDPQALADHFRDLVIPYFAALYVPAWQIEPVYVTQEKDPQNPFAPRGSWTSGSVRAGSRVISGDLLPRACCAVVTLKTDRIGKRYTGRLFVGGNPSEADQADGTWTSNALQAVQLYMDAIPRAPDIATGISDSSAHWSVFSRTNRAQHLDPYLTPVATPIVRTGVHWLRSRAQF